MTLDARWGLRYVSWPLDQTKGRVGARSTSSLADAAARLFRQKGFDATTVRQIAKAAGMLPGSVHYRYPTKAALLLALMRRGVEADLACMRAAIAPSRDPVERLRLAMRARVRYLLSRDAATVVLYDWRSLKGRAREEMIRLRDRYEAFWAGLLHEAAGAGPPASGHRPQPAALPGLRRHQLDHHVVLARRVAHARRDQRRVLRVHRLRSGRRRASREPSVAARARSSSRRASRGAAGQDRERRSGLGRGPGRAEPTGDAFWRFRMSRKVSLLFAALLLRSRRAHGPGAAHRRRPVAAPSPTNPGRPCPGPPSPSPAWRPTSPAPPPPTRAGRYLVAALPPGAYRIAVELSGFAAAAPRGRGARARARPRTSTSSSSWPGPRRTITVTGEAPLVDPTHTAVSSVVGQQQIESLPINGRNFLSFSVITPGVTTDRTPQQGASATSGLSFGGPARALEQHHGGRPRQQRPRRRRGARDLQPGGHPRVPGADQLLLRGVRQGLGRRRQHRDQERHQRAARQRLLLLPRREPERQGPLREGRRVRQRRSTARRRPSASSSGAPPSAAPSSRTGRSSSCPSSAWTSTANNFVNIDPAAAAVLRAAGFPVELGNVPYEFKTTEFLAKIDHQWSPEPQPGPARQLLRHHQREHRALRRHRRPQPRRGAAPHGLGHLAPRRPTSSPRAGSTRRASSSRTRTRRSSPSIPTAAGPATTNDEGGPTLEVTGVASVGRQRFTPAAARSTSASRSTDTMSYFGGQPPRQGRLRLQLHRHQGHRAAAALRRPLHLPVAARRVLAAVGLPPRATPLSAMRGAGARACPPPTCRATAATGRVVQGLGPLAVRAGRLARSPPQLTLKAGRPLPEAVSVRRHRLHGLQPRRHDAHLRLSRRQQQHRAARWPWPSIPRATGARRCTPPTGSSTTTRSSPSRRSANGIDGSADGVRTLVARFPASIAALACARPPHPGAHHAVSRAWSSRPIPGSRRPTRTRPRSASTAPSARDFSRGRELRLRARQAPARHASTTTRSSPPWAPAGGPTTSAACAGTSASVLQYTVVRRDLVPGPDRLASTSASARTTSSWPRTRSPRPRTTPPTSRARSSCRTTDAAGTRPIPPGLPLGFDPDSEKGPATHDQRHRFVLSRAATSSRGTSSSRRSSPRPPGRPFTPLAGADLNGDGDGGAFPSDRARRNPDRPGQQRGPQQRNDGRPVHRGRAAEQEVPLRRSARRST